MFKRLLFIFLRNNFNIFVETATKGYLHGKAYTSIQYYSNQ